MKIHEIEEDREVTAMCRGLGLDDGPGGRVQRIIDYCRNRVTEIATAHSAHTPAEIEKAVCRSLSLRIVRVWSDEDLEDLIAEYLRKGEGVFLTLREDLKGDTFATLIERANGVTGRCKDRYVAVIDCRDVKAARQFFTKWHEIAHVLTLYKQLELPLHRSFVADSNEAIEKLMDLIAAEVGFLPQLCRPLVERELEFAGRLTIQGVKNVVDALGGEPSFDATANACLKFVPHPTLKLKLAYCLKPTERRPVSEGEAPPTPKLRVTEVVANPAVRSSPRLYIPKFYRVPLESKVHTAATNPMMTGTHLGENLGMWSSSSGTSLAPRDVVFETGFIGDQLYVLVTAMDN